ncbi:MAG TPA: neutral/alkaline non-lysosomal ceramidase N-terminal domain-containing protein [Terriglobales bacterium]|nr:neutral/alkaline non-lysosomal ceramidase N-terminal domain-containing protein [Terriglobales bacterium]
MKKHFKVLAIVMFLAYTSSVCSQTVPSGPLLVGAAKVDITPAPNELPKNFLGILDHVWSRAIYIDNGKTGAVLVSLDAGGIPTQTASDIRARVQKEFGIPVANVLISGTHTHSAPFIGRFAFGPNRDTTPDTTGAYIEKIFSSIRKAKEALQPAKVSFGEGVSYLNVQRDQIDPVTHGWWEGANYSGLSDKTVAVVKFVSMKDEPIAVYFNYAMHAVITGNLDLVSGDFPGAASRYIERALGDKAVALFTSGAAGDQNPIYFQQTYDLREIRIKEYAKRGEDISNAMPPGGQGLDRKNPEVARLMEEQKEMSNSMGQLLGEEVLRAMREAKPGVSDVRIFGKESTVTCPGRNRTNQGRGGIQGTYTDGPDVNITVDLLMINDIAVGAVNGEVYNAIAQRLKRESPYSKTMMITVTNGFANSGYIPDDASFGHQTFEVLSSRLKPGCAETGIVEGIIGMMPKITY